MPAGWRTPTAAPATSWTQPRPSAGRRQWPSEELGLGCPPRHYLRPSGSLLVPSADASEWGDGWRRSSAAAARMLSS